ncbi:MAG TPA: septum formation initiator [Synergistaceae bacterium]|jgi:cell division protein FtsB|nr:septum formation initiator family protein [Synergistaceae bacterium]MCK9438443.1 septum formation initiator family protein [Synergistaceae bacterium]MDD2350666.1 septum formation initiator family protein [Synergistaceae bacterium]MDD3318945.1 septum formation initiator family protein [Synergistaceae bacterium]MDD3673005.1 septum formation initiator family protein [Synergistaceae bacterium]
MKAPRLRWIIFAAAVTFLIAVLLTSFFKELERIDVLSGTLDKRMEELVAEERKSQELKQKIEYYSTPEGIARLAREQFNLVLSGEVIYKIEITSNDVLH